MQLWDFMKSIGYCLNDVECDYFVQDGSDEDSLESEQTDSQESRSNKHGVNGVKKGGHDWEIMDGLKVGQIHAITHAPHTHTHTYTRPGDHGWTEGRTNTHTHTHTYTRPGDHGWTEGRTNTRIHAHTHAHTNEQTNKRTHTHTIVFSKDSVRFVHLSRKIKLFTDILHWN